jgi:tetratricopeptide (TPR) repeat protein
MLKEARAKDPKATLFAEDLVNALGYEYLQGGDAKGAVEIFMLNVEAYPNSANVYDSVSDAYLATGQKDPARENAKKALELEAEFIATGHYARLDFDEGSGWYLLKKGLDRRKDQSYVLFSLTQAQFRRTLFPVGEHRKEDVRKIALHLGLRVHDKPESQEVCFIQSVFIIFFLSERLKESVESGPILYVMRKGICV